MVSSMLALIKGPWKRAIMRSRFDAGLGDMLL